MPFDCFSPFGVFEFSSAPSPCEKQYDEITRSMGPAFQGPVQDALNYSAAMSLGCAQVQMEGAAAQRDPLQVTALIGALEHDYLVYPKVTDSLNVRRRRLAAAMAVSNGCTDEAVDAMLRGILGDALNSWRVLDLDTEVSVAPNEDPGTIVPATTPIKVVSLNQIAWPGEKTVTYTRVLDDDQSIVSGDQLVVGTGTANEETVVVTSATATTFTATFTKVHEIGELATTQTFPNWSSTRRHYLILVTAETLSNAELIQQVETGMRKITTGVSTWCISDQIAADTPRPFTVGLGLIGLNPIGPES